MRGSEREASFTLTRDEARRATGLIWKRYDVAVGTTMLFSLTISSFFIGLGHDWSTWYYVFLPVCAGVLLLRQMLRALPVRSGVATTIRLDERGVRTEGPRHAALPWRAVADTHDSGEFLILYLHGKPWSLVRARIVIPKRAFDDGGRAATQLFAEAPLRNSPSLA